jgi:hypothetical protein
MERHDHAAVVASFAPDVVLRSPIIPRHFEGRDAVSDLLAAVMATFDGYRYTAEGDVEGIQMLCFTARVRGVDVEAVDAMRVNDEGLVSEVTVYIRPMAGLAAVAAALGPHLARGPVQRVVVSALAAPLATLLRLVQPLIPRLIRLR